MITNPTLEAIRSILSITKDAQIRTIALPTKKKHSPSISATQPRRKKTLRIKSSKWKYKWNMAYTSSRLAADISASKKITKKIQNRVTCKVLRLLGIVRIIRIYILVLSTRKGSRMLVYLLAVCQWGDR